MYTQFVNDPRDAKPGFLILKGIQLVLENISVKSTID